MESDFEDGWNPLLTEENDGKEEIWEERSLSNLETSANIAISRETHKQIEETNSPTPKRFTLET